MQHAAAYPHPRRASTVFFLTCLSLSLSLSLAQKRVPVDFDSLQAGSDLRMDDFMTFVLWTALLRWHLGRHLS